MENLPRVVLYLFSLVLSLTFHEFAHAWTAWRCGDDTAERQGRLTLNPLAHLDPVGSVLILMSAFNLSPIGWAKPVPVAPWALRRPARDHMLVAAAGPAANLLVGTAAWILYMGVQGALTSGWLPASNAFLSLLDIALALLVVNLSLAFFNLIPLGPLDGAAVLGYFLPHRWKEPYASLNQYGMFILLGLLMSGLINALFRPLWALIHLLLGA